MTNDSGDSGQTYALAMVEAFASVGATHFVVSWTSSAGSPRRPRALKKALQSRACAMPATPQNDDWLNAVFIENISRAELTGIMPALLDTATTDRLNLIVRPYGASVSFVQLDDLKPDRLSPLAPAVFLALETSPGNFQAWVAMPAGEDKDFARRLRKGTGADPTASGATRVAGSFNFKDKYAPNFPRVKLRQVNPGRLTQAAELDRLGLVAAPETVAQPLRITPARLRPSGSNRKWPSYERCLDGAPPSQSNAGKPRHSIADFTWCMIASDWGWPVEETARRLMEESAKARENGPVYALQTATRAAEAAARNAERRQQQPKRHGNG